VHQMSLPTSTEYFGPLLVVDGNLVPRDIRSSFGGAMANDVPYVSSFTSEEADMVMLGPTLSGYNSTECRSFFDNYPGLPLVNATDVYTSNDCQLAYAQLTTDIRFICEGINIAKLLATNPSYRSPTWQVIFTQWPGQAYPFFPDLGIEWQSSYAFHTFDMFSLAGTASSVPKYKPTSGDMQFQSAIRNLWHNFVHNPPAFSLQQFHSPDFASVLVNSTNLTPAPGYRADHCAYLVRQSVGLNYTISN